MQRWNLNTNKGSKRCKIVGRLCLILLFAAMSYFDIYSQETTNLDTDRINEILMKDVVKPYLEINILPRITLGIENEWVRYDSSIYGNLKTSYKKPEIADSLKNSILVVDIKKYHNIYFIYGWKNDSLIRVASTFNPEEHDSGCEKIAIGKYYDISLEDYFDSLGRFAPFTSSSIRYFSYTKDRDGEIVYIFREPEIGIFTIYESPDLNGLYIQKRD